MGDLASKRAGAVTRDAERLRSSTDHLLRARCNRLLSPTGSSPIRATPRCKDEATSDDVASGKQLTEISRERVAPRRGRGRRRGSL